MELDEVARRVDRLAEDLTGAADAAARADPGARALAADGPGTLFAAGRDLHDLYRSALAARERETVAHGARLAELAGQLRRAADGYREAEHGAHHRQAGGPGGLGGLSGPGTSGGPGGLDGSGGLGDRADPGQDR